MAIRRFWTQIEIDIGSFEDHGDVTVDDVQPLSIMALGLFIQAFSDGLPTADSRAEAGQGGESSEASVPEARTS